MSNPSPNQKRRILVIDDNDAIHADFRKILTPSNRAVDVSDDEAAIFGEPATSARGVEFEIDSARQGEQGYQCVTRAVASGQPYQVAFVDMRMPPGWDGVQTVIKLWEADPHLQVVICTAFSDYSWDQIVSQLGSTDRMLILKKPFDEVEVCQLATALTTKWLVTVQANLKMVELERLVQARTAELKHAALVDKLTGLPNRELLSDRLGQLLQQVRRDASNKFAVLFLDFDRFKVVNDSLGHEVGDLLLIAIAERLRTATRGTDTVTYHASINAARLGGDEFVVILDQLAEYHDAARVAERLLEALAVPYELRGHVVHCTASAGITTSALGYSHPDEMIRDADAAMYCAKAAGKARYVLFDQAMHQTAVIRLAMETDLRHAIQREELVLHYQPVISLNSGRINGFEALIRWNHPTRGLILPGEFIAVAEEIGLIVPIGYWVLNEACRQVARWQQVAGLEGLTLNVNLSRKQIGAPGLVPTIQKILEDTGFSASSLKLEITENTIMDDPEGAVLVLGQIHAMGVRLYVDDFGTGYSSLSCLHRFPISGLKLDRGFVSMIGERREYAAVVNAIIALANNLNMELVAEGVEHVSQAAMLQAMGCELAQGYLFARPSEPAAALDFALSRPQVAAQSTASPSLIAAA